MKCSVNILNRQPFKFQLKNSHILISGATGSGKTSLETMLCLAGLRSSPDVQVCGFDGGGTLFSSLPFSSWRWCIGDGSEACLEVMEKLIAELDRRLKSLRVNRLPEIEPNSASPRLLIFVEELPSIILSLQAADISAGTRKTADKLETRFRAGLARLGSESRKCGFNLVIASQEANKALLEGLRNNCKTRICFRQSLDEFSMSLRFASDLAKRTIEKANPGLAVVSYGGQELIIQFDFLPYSLFLSNADKWEGVKVAILARKKPPRTPHSSARVRDYLPKKGLVLPPFLGPLFVACRKIN
jgi:hypothetical protein